MSAPIRLDPQQAAMLIYRKLDCFQSATIWLGAWYLFGRRLHPDEYGQGIYENVPGCVTQIRVETEPQVRNENNVYRNEPVPDI